MKKFNSNHADQAVSIITCTKRPDCMHTLFRNYGRQNYKHKELIVILNHKNMKLSEYKEVAKPYKNVRIYRLPEHVTLGRCLNYAVQRSRHLYIAKFDDDDYYSANYLADSMRTMRKHNADIVGKRAHFMYVKGRKTLLLRFADMENKYVPYVQGATLIVKRHVFNRVVFPNRNLGECLAFCSNSLAKGYKIYAGNRNNFIAMRSKNSKNHTWKVSEKKLMTKYARVLKVTNIRKFVSQN